MTPLTLLSFLLMVLSSLIAAYSDISRTIEISNTALPHSSDDPFSNENQSNLIPGFESLKNEKDNLLNLTGNLGFKNGMQGVLASGYLWMALNCFCSAAYVSVEREREEDVSTISDQERVRKTDEKCLSLCTFS